MQVRLIKILRSTNRLVEPDVSELWQDVFEAVKSRIKTRGRVDVRELASREIAQQLNRIVNDIPNLTDVTGIVTFKSNGKAKGVLEEYKDDLVITIDIPSEVLQLHGTAGDYLMLSKVASNADTIFFVKIDSSILMQKVDTPASSIQ